MEKSHTQSNHIVFYDAGCGFCNKVVNFMRPRYLNINFTPSNKISNFPGLLSSKEILDLKNYLYLVKLDSRENYKGYYAFQKIAQMKRKTFLIYLIMRVPGVIYLGKIIYKFIAANRSKISGSGSNCEI
jgi:predicted DCC family thiol-disulfide oxidoreductase YuxK